MNEALAFGLLLFAAFFGLWLYSGGPSHPLSYAGPYITPITNVGQTSTGYGKPLTLGSYDVPYIRQGGVGPVSGSISYTSNAPALDARYGVASPFRGAVKLSSVNTTQNSHGPSDEYVRIIASSDAGYVNITGWRLISDLTGNSVTIPQGARFPTSRYNGGALSDIVLTNGQIAVITTGSSPTIGSFLENRCTAYFNSDSTFAPAYSSYSCMSPSAEFSRFYTGNDADGTRCQSYINSLPSCQIPSDYSENIKGVPSTCINFARDHFSYAGCLSYHKTDSDFFGNSWRIYLSRAVTQWRQSNDTIKLLDANGKTVDVYTY
jgi:hypothetical protein